VRVNVLWGLWTLVGFSRCCLTCTYNSLKLLLHTHIYRDTETKREKSTALHHHLHQLHVTVQFDSLLIYAIRYADLKPCSFVVDVTCDIISGFKSQRYCKALHYYTVTILSVYLVCHTILLSYVSSCILSILHCNKIHTQIYSQTVALCPYLYCTSIIGCSDCSRVVVFV